MRLIHTKTYTLEDFNGQEVPYYAILSHTWGKEEIVFEDVRGGPERIPTRKQGYAKFQGACARARLHGYGYVWIDTCCIDKSSSAELSEAINSMWQWYRDAAVCYAYLSDFRCAGAGGADQDGPGGGGGVGLAGLGRSRWFGRGWTLQELIAPRDVIFFDRDWVRLDQRRSPEMARRLADVTGIDYGLLTAKRPKDAGAAGFVDDLLAGFSVAARMSWAAARETTRPEDAAYCLMGLFGVNMPLLYGEGGKAFARLQEEILKVSADQSVLAFHFDFRAPILAASPSQFLCSGSIVKPTCALEEEALDISLTKRGLFLDARVFMGSALSPYGRYYDIDDQCLVILDCAVSGNPLMRPAFLASVKSTSPSLTVVYRLIGSPIFVRAGPDWNPTVPGMDLEPYVSAPTDYILVPENITKRRVLVENFKRGRVERRAITSGTHPCVRIDVQMQDKLDREWRRGASCPASFPADSGGGGGGSGSGSGSSSGGPASTVYVESFMSPSRIYKDLSGVVSFHTTHGGHGFFVAWGVTLASPRTDAKAKEEEEGQGEGEGEGEGKQASPHWKQMEPWCQALGWAEFQREFLSVETDDSVVAAGAGSPAAMPPVAPSAISAEWLGRRWREMELGVLYGGSGPYGARSSLLCGSAVVRAKIAKAEFLGRGALHLTVTLGQRPSELRRISGVGVGVGVGGVGDKVADPPRPRRRRVTFTEGDEVLTDPRVRALAFYPR